MRKRRLTCHQAFLATLLALEITSLGVSQISIVAPTGLDKLEGETLQNAAPRLAFRTHSLYDASYFSELDGPHLLIGAQERLDETETIANEGNFERITYRFSTITKSSLNSTFDDNIGLDETLVFDGPRTDRLPAEEIDEGPQEIAPPVMFDTPFLYDPSQGNLLMDVWTPSGPERAAILDAEPTAGIHTIVGVPPSAPTGLFSFRNVLVREFLFDPLKDGDLNHDNAVDAADIDLLSKAIRDELMIDNKLDLDESGSVDFQDHEYMVETVISTWYGDSNLDGEFNTSDFVDVFQTGHFEDGIPMNSGWVEGDWNGNGDFDTGDFVTAFQHGGFERGPRRDVASVPESGGFLGILTSLVMFHACLRRNISSLYHQLGKLPEV